MISLPFNRPMNTSPSQASFVGARSRKGKRAVKTKTSHHKVASMPRPCILITTNELLDMKSNIGERDSLRITLATPTLPPSFFNIFKHIRTLDLRKVGLDVLPPQIVELEN